MDYNMMLNINIQRQHCDDFLKVWTWPVYRCHYLQRWESPADTLITFPKSVETTFFSHRGVDVSPSKNGSALPWPACHSANSFTIFSHTPLCAVHAWIWVRTRSLHHPGNLFLRQRNESVQCPLPAAAFSHETRCSHRPLLYVCAASANHPFRAKLSVATHSNAT